MTAIVFIGLFVLFAVGAIIASFTVKWRSENPAWDKYGRNPEGTQRYIEAGWPKLAFRAAAGLFIVLAGIILWANSFYTQEYGEAKVVKNYDGTIERVDDTAGPDWKSPMQELIDWDILAQQAIYKGDGKPTSEGEVVRGPQIQFQAAGGTIGDIDIAIRYSIEGDKVDAIQKEFRTQDILEQRLIDQDIRSVVRTAPASYAPLDVRAKRGEVEAKIVDMLKARWSGKGVNVDSVALQGVRYDQKTEEGFQRVQQAQANVATETANLEAAKVTAQQKVVSAKAEAEANNILAASLSDKIIQQRGLDTLKALGDKGNVIITDGKTIPMVNVQPAK